MFGIKATRELINKHKPAIHQFYGKLSIKQVDILPGKPFSG